MVNETKPIPCFLHIPKTGGSTLRDIINRQYNDKEILLIPKITDVNKLISSIDENRLKNIKIIQGHLSSDIQKYFNNQIHFFTILRDPVQRVISQYYYVQSNRNNPHNKYFNNKDFTLTDYYNSGINPYLSNGQAKFIIGKKFQNLNDDQLLEQSLRIINTSFVFVGILELFNESLLILKNKLNWKNVYYSKANKTKLKKIINHVTKKEKQLIINNNSVDIELYNIHKKILIENINQTNLKSQLELFNSVNKIVGSFYISGRLSRKFKKIFKFR